MTSNNLVVISNNFPDKNDIYCGNIFVKEQIKYLRKYYGNIYVISPVAYGQEYLRKIRHENYQFDNVHVFFPNYFNFPLFYKYGRDFWIHFEKRAILKLIKNTRMKFDLIHAHFTWPSGAVAIELKKKFNVPVVITEHTSRTFNNAIKKKESQFIQSWKLSDAIVRVNKSDMPLFTSVGIPLDKVYYIPNGYDPIDFLTLDSKNCRNDLGLPFDKKIILNVGNLYDEAKGHRYLIEAMAEIVKYKNDVLCVIVGGGKLESKLINQNKSLGLQDYVKLVGMKPHNEISLWMNACDVFVLPSLKESFGIVQIEAMACGKPVVATFNGGSEELITSKCYGLLCEPGDSKKLARNILIALDKAWDEKQIKKYAGQFTWNSLVKDIFEIHSKVL